MKCLTKNLAPNRLEGSMELVDIIPIPFHTLHIDHFGPLQEATKKRTQLLVIIDAYTKFVWLFPCVSTTTESVVTHLTNLFNQFGNPIKIISDRGTAFTSSAFSIFLKDLDIKHIMTAVASPWANGTVERVNRFLKATLAKLVEQPKNWIKHIGKTQYILNNTYHRSINATPGKMLLGYDQRNSDDRNLRDYLDLLLEVDHDLEKSRQEIRDNASIVNRAVQQYNKKRYDQKHKRPSLYKEGDLVAIRVTQFKTGVNRKLASKYNGPYRVGKILKKNRFVITDVPELGVTPPLNTILSPDKLRPWIKIGTKSPEDNHKKVDTSNDDTSS